MPGFPYLHHHPPVIGEAPMDFTCLTCHKPVADVVHVAPPVWPYVVSAVIVLLAVMILLW